MENSEEIKYYWYILFVKTGYENEVVRTIEGRFNENDFYPFLPLLELHHKYAYKRIEIEQQILFPGYVFIESSLNSELFYNRIREFVYSNEKVFKILRYGNSHEIAVRDEERELLLALCNDNMCIENSVGFIVGDKIIVTEGPLKGRESMIVDFNRHNRHNRRAIIEIEMFGRNMRIDVGLEIIKRLAE